MPVLVMDRLNKGEKVFNRIKLGSAGIMIIASYGAYAGSVGEACQTEQVGLPCKNNVWHVGAQALYLQPSYNDKNANYIGEIVDNINDNNTYTYFVDNQQSWRWGFKLDVAYEYSAGKDLTADWYHLGKNAQTQTFDEIAIYGFGDVINSVLTTTPQWDALNIELGQQVNFGLFKNIRFHGGVQYTRISTNVSLTGTNENDNSSYQGSDNSSFSGFGPRIGLDMAYNLFSSINLYADTSIAGLVGSSKITKVILTGGDNGGRQDISGSHTTLVPALELKAGAQLSTAMFDGVTTLDVGYLWVNYFDAQTLYVETTRGNDDADFGIHGPYVGLKWVGSFI